MPVPIIIRETISVPFANWSIAAETSGRATLTIPMAVERTSQAISRYPGGPRPRGGLTLNNPLERYWLRFDLESEGVERSRVLKWIVERQPPTRTRATGIPRSTGFYAPLSEF